MENKLENLENSKTDLERPQITEIKQVVKTKLFNIEAVSLVFSNGEIREFERFKEWEPGVVLMVPMLDHDTLLLTQEYAAGINDYTLSFPKGRIELGEDCLYAANRELQEEIKYKSNRLSYLQAMTSSPNYSATQMHVVLAEALEPSALEGDEPEPISVIPWSLQEIPSLLARRDFHEARSIAALFLVKEFLNKRLYG